MAAPADKPLTGREFMEATSQVLGRPVPLRVMSPSMLRLAGLFSPLVREAVEVHYQFEQPFIMDASKFARAFGAQVTPSREAIQQIVRASRSAPEAEARRSGPKR